MDQEKLDASGTEKDRSEPLSTPLENTMNDEDENMPAVTAPVEKTSNIVKTENGDSECIEKENPPLNDINDGEMLASTSTSSRSTDECSGQQFSNNSRGGKRSRFMNRHYRARRDSSSSNEDIADGPEDRSSNEQQQLTPSPSSNSESDNNEIEAGPYLHTDEESGDSYMSLDDLNCFFYESDDSVSSGNDNSSVVCPKQRVMSKAKPDYNWNITHEMMYREQGLINRKCQSNVGKSQLTFQNKFYSARQTVERLELLHALKSHQGCVNCLNFNKAGDLLVTGSDDLKIIIWNWSGNKIKCKFNSGHVLNVFQTKFVESSGGGIHIVSSARDGQVRSAIIPPSGGKPASSLLVKHSGSVHKISLSPHNPYEVLSAGEDGYVKQHDLRSGTSTKILQVRSKKHQIPLFSIAQNPLDPEFCVCGRDQFVRVYDKRNTKSPVSLMFPQHLENKKISHVTCAVYNWNGNEILASYSGEDVYLFEKKYYLPGHFTHRYQGHRNIKTIKGVNFFGLNSEYVVSGSDCGNFFLWDKKTESIINWIKGDNGGVVNCLEPHPSFPVLATSGLDRNIKVWVPSNKEIPPQLDGLEKCLRRNIKRDLHSENDHFDTDMLLFLMRPYSPSRRLQARNLSRANRTELMSSDSNDEGDYVEDEDDEEPLFQHLPCAPQ